ncbi:hypothetical protein J5500_03645 [Candidatus Saccharibacteria bacterium]|nr:hypothetical protein [Candidatus Saccharibacteria bacterium]
MYRITNADEQILLTVTEYDAIEKLTPVLGEATIKILRDGHVNIVKDMINLEPVAFLNMTGIDASMREKILIVCRYLFRGAYDNLHG